VAIRGWVRGVDLTRGGPFKFRIRAVDRENGKGILGFCITKHNKIKKGEIKKTRKLASNKKKVQ